MTRVMSSCPGAAARSPRHAGMPLLDLVDRVAREADSRALEEIHSFRRPFRSPDRGVMSFIEYVSGLRETPRAWEYCHNDGFVLDVAFDLVVEKFSSLPNPADKRWQFHQRSDESVKQTQTDCRYYFEAFLTHVEGRLELWRSLSAVERESELEWSLTRHVKRHFYLSCLEALRRTRRLETRYVWHVNGGSLCLWLPRDIAGSKRRDWLEQHVKDVNLSQPGERERVQARIHRMAFKRRIFSFSDLHGGGRQIRATVPEPSANIERAISVDGLAETVAKEKADSIHRRGRAIQQLGKQRLMQMVGVIFDNLSHDLYKPAHVAREFGLDKATFSRFAGTRWLQSGNRAGSNSIPDLWLNVAQTLAKHPAFREAAQEYGVWSGVVDVLHANAPSDAEEDDG